MNARGKLNQAYLNGAIFVAIVAATITQSAVVFLLVLAVLLVTSLGDGSIRMASHRVTRTPAVRRPGPHDERRNRN